MSNGTDTNWQNDDLARWYNKNLVGEEGMKAYAKNFAFAEEDEILDLGCGDGSFLSLAGAAGIKRGVGVDVSAYQLNVSREKTAKFKNMDFVFSNFQDLLFPAESFTKISTRKAMHHLTNDEKGVLLDKCHKWLKPGGLFIVEDMILTFALHRKDERRALVEKEAEIYYGDAWPNMRDAFFTTMYVELPCDLAQLSHHLLFTGFNIKKIINHTSFIGTVIAQK